MNRRRGFTLIELIAVFAAMTVVLLLCAGLIHALLRLDRSGRAHGEQEAALGLLARAVRRDVRAATALEPIPFAEGPAAWLPLALPRGRSVEYRGRPGALIRTERTAEAIVRTETFRLPPDVAVRWEVEGPADRPVVGLVLVTGAPQPAGAAAIEGFRIVGVLGRDHRFERGGD